MAKDNGTPFGFKVGLAIGDRCPQLNWVNYSSIAYSGCCVSPRIDMKAIFLVTQHENEPAQCCMLGLLSYSCSKVKLNRAESCFKRFPGIVLDDHDESICRSQYILICIRHGNLSRRSSLSNRSVQNIPNREDRSKAARRIITFKFIVFCTMIKEIVERRWKWRKIESASYKRKEQNTE